jgi:hypothetical protein
MEQHMVEMLLDPYQIIGGKHSKQFSGTIDTNGMAVSFHYKCTTSRLRRLPINEGGKSAASHVSGLIMEHIGSIDPDKDKLVAVGNDHPKGLLRTLCRDSYHLFSHGKENTVRQQHLDATVRDELHELSPWTGKVVTYQDFQNQFEAQGTTWPERFEVGIKQSVVRRRFDTATAKRKVLDNFWQSVRDQSVEVVMYGSAHIEPNGKAVQGVAKIAKQHMQVLPTPKHNTTTQCAGCLKEAEKCGQRHQSIRCRSTGCVE